MLRFTLIVLFSLLLHFSMYTAIEYAPMPLQPGQQTEVELVESDQSKNTVEQKDLEKSVIKNSTESEPTDLSKPADFVAEKNQRFEKQTRVEKNGVFHNANPAQQLKHASKQNQQAQQKSKAPASENPKSDDDLPEFARAIQAQQQSSQSQFNNQTSSSPYDLPQDINLGTATNLNADASVYASFYNRVIDLFYVRWAQNLDYIFDRLPFDIKRQLSGKNWSTELEILLNSDGVYQKGYILKNSGFRQFDDAGLNAFKDAKVFPNPPRAKVESDGFVRLKYRILVQIR